MSEFVQIKVSTGYVGADHYHDTGLTVEEWENLTASEQEDWLKTAIVENVDAYPIAVNDDCEERCI